MRKRNLLKTINNRLSTYGKAVVIREFFGLSTIVRVDELVVNCGPGQEHLPHRITVGDEGYLPEGCIFDGRCITNINYKHGYALPICWGSELYCDLEELVLNEDILKVL